MLRRGRLKLPMDELASRYTSSMEADRRIFEPVVHINLAHALMLVERGMLSPREVRSILLALLKLLKRGPSALDLRPELEDIHLAVEQFVIKEAGEAGEKLHTAKSRNDQVATAIRMTLKKNLLELQQGMLKLLDALIEQAGKNLQTLMPGYTHLQVAQPTTFAHYLLAYALSFLRDFDRLTRAFEQADACPMGACALAGTGFPIDRPRVAKLLGFKRLALNTMDAVSSRDFALEALSALAILMANLSRLSEELVLWSSPGFDLVSIPEEFTATSSIMPQKKNPVVAEVSRAKASRVAGDLSSALSLVKGLPQSYNLDLQELTPLLWDALDHSRDSVEVMAKLLRALRPNPKRMLERAEEGFAAATELADELVRKAGLAFRQAHEVIGEMVAQAIREGKQPRALKLADLQRASKRVLGREVKLRERDFNRAWDLSSCVRLRRTPGGPAPKAVRAQLQKLRQELRSRSRLLLKNLKALSQAERELLGEVERRSR